MNDNELQELNYKFEEELKSLIAKYELKGLTHIRILNSLCDMESEV
jgi:hypothetical protein